MTSTDTYLDHLAASMAAEEARDALINDWFEGVASEDPYLASVMLQGPTDDPFPGEPVETALFTHPTSWFLAHLQDMRVRDGV